MTTSERMIEILRHSLGLDMHGRGRMYRSYYCLPIDFESTDRSCIREMVAAGLMKEGNTLNEGKDQYFYVTDAGRAAAVKDVKPLRITPGQQRYRDFLNFDGSMTFIEFVKWQQRRERNVLARSCHTQPTPTMKRKGSTWDYSENC